MSLCQTFHKSKAIVGFATAVLALLALHSHPSNKDAQSPSISLRTSSRRLTTSLTSDTSPSLHIAWLMSFPNSGTTYTSALVQTGSGYSTATNYGHEFSDEKGKLIKVSDSTPVFDDTEDGKYGPFRFSNLALPSKFVLTKTHCGGFGFSDCRPRDYALSPDTFLHECLRSAHFTPDPNKPTVKFQAPPAIREWTQYDPDLVKKAVHIIRNPLDNAVARFHHEWKLHDIGVTFELPDWHNAEYSNDRDGFRAWCKDTDSRFVMEKKQYLPPNAESYADQGVLCHAEFYKYVQWHNQAFTVTTYLGMQSPFVLHYEDFDQNFDGTVKLLFDYLEMPMENDLPTFKWRGYEEDFYSKEERKLIREYIKNLSTLDTWSHLHRYFPEE